MQDIYNATDDMIRNRFLFEIIYVLL